MNKKSVSLLRRLAVPIVVIAAWFVLGGIGGPYFGKIDEVSSNDLSTFLPSNAESTVVKDELAKFQTKGTLPAIVVFESNGELSEKQQNEISAVRSALQTTGKVKGDVSPAVISDDKKAAFLAVPIDSDGEFDEIITSLQKAIADTSPSLAYKFTGPAMFSRDLNKAFAGIDGTLLFVALGVVFLILLIVYRSPILPLITLVGAILALAVSILLVWHLANAGIVQLNGQVQGILFILVIGAATDYALLYIARYREELTRHETAWKATIAAWKAAWEPIVAAGGTVALGLLCLLASDLQSNKALGPVGAIGVGFAVLSALTFLPAMLLLVGRGAFWPKKPKVVTSERHASYETTHPAWARVGRLVGRHPRRLWVGISVVLVVACCFVPQLRAEGVSQENLILGKSEARDGQEMLTRHFPSGSGSPAYVLVPKEEQGSITAKLDADKGIDAVSVLTTDTKLSSMPVGEARETFDQKIYSSVATERTKQLSALRAELETQMAGAPMEVIDSVFNEAASQIPSVDELSEKANPYSDLVPKTVDGFVVLQATLNDTASSVAARETIARLRSTIQAQYPEVKFGGVSAIQLDTNASSDRDVAVVIPLILVAITIVLMLLLRSIVAPLVLLVTTILSFGATLGIGALLFNNVWHFAGADPAVVIFGFVFLVALGIDYNIFLMSRVREETKALGVRKGTLKALVVTGGVITSAGIVLASTFTALIVIPILFLVQIAFVVAFGVLLDTLVVRSLLVPSLTLQIGRLMWWPSKLWRSTKK